ncbi:DUF1579 domain-containing protein [Longimicrobium sp.]|jgi:hypothetical protein|uniref:DUF1579 domain-containing protein n=1 Tax=Longimicrobium sp. TaxID=2029185 RepID=UPI002ED9B94F
MNGEPQTPHEFLERLVGEWTWEMDASEPDGTPMKGTGSESVRLLGTTWALCDGRDGESMSTLMTLGYDPATQRFKGTFVGSMMTHIWIYDGELDASGNLLTLDTEGPSYEQEGTMARYQDTIEFRGDDHRVLTSRYVGGDGEWKHFMTSHYRRVT